VPGTQRLGLASQRGQMGNSGSRPEADLNGHPVGGSGIGGTGYTPTPLRRMRPRDRWRTLCWGVRSDRFAPRGIITGMVKMDGPWPFQGRVVWLTPEQGGRSSGPPPPSTEWDYAHTAFVPPHTSESGLASFALRNFKPDAWTSGAEGRWLIVENEGDQLVGPGTVVVCTEGSRVVAYFHVQAVVDMTTA
jgi:hypothetical protein